MSSSGSTGKTRQNRARERPGLRRLDPFVADVGSLKGAGPMQERPVETTHPGAVDVLRRDRPGAVRLPANLLRVPPVKQNTDYSCGNAATLALLRYWRW